MKLFYKKITRCLSQAGIFTLTLLSLSLWWGCKEEIDYKADSPLPDGDYYFTVKIAQTGLSSTRDFNDGVASEYAIAEGNYNFMFLYDGEGSLLNVVTLSNPTVTVDGNNSENDNLTETLVGAFRVAGKTKDLLQAELDKIKECLVILNTNLFQDVDFSNPTDKNKYTKNYLTGLTMNCGAVSDENPGGSHGQIKVGDQYYFTMSNSVYIDNGKLMYGPAISLNTDNLFFTEKEALEANNSNINVYVERLAAKVSVKFNGNNNVLDKATPQQGYTKVRIFSGLNDDWSYIENAVDYKDWEATVLGVAVNGLEPKEYIYKQIFPNGNYFTNWSNQTSEFRSFWSVDPNYDVASNLSKYPNQYRKALENNQIRGYHDNLDYSQEGSINSFTKDNSNYCLKYFSLNDFLDKNGLISEEGVRALYLLENTYSDNNADLFLGDRGYFSAGSHLLVACRLHITGYNDGIDLYRDQNDIFYNSPENLLKAKLDIMQNKMLSGGNSGIRVLNANWLNHDYYNADLITVTWEPDDKLMLGNRILDYNDLTFIPAELTGGDGHLLIAPNNKNADFYLGNPDTGKKTPIDYNRIVSLFHKLLGPIDHFKNGYMYYALPILHNETDLDNANWNETGDFGTLRNNWYSFYVSGVTSPGTPVDQLDQPIIPMMDVKRSYLNMSVVLVGWHDLNSPDWPFLPNL